MPQVIGTYPDYQKHTLKSYFSLEGDKEFNPYTWSPRILWEGTVGVYKDNLYKLVPPGQAKVIMIGLVFHRTWKLQSRTSLKQ